MKNLTLLLLIALSAFTAFSQTPQAGHKITLSEFCRTPLTNSTAGKLEKHIYKKYTTEKGKEKTLNIGVTRPVDNLSIKKRPAIIGVHGGGFVDFCIFEPCYVKYSENILEPFFSTKGFVTIAVQYRLTKPLDFKLPKISDDVLRETHYKAVQDVRQAIKFVFEHADEYGIDKDNIFLTGSSAGAITALHAAYLDNDEAPADLAGKFGRLEEKEPIRAVMSLSGAIYDLNYLTGDSKTPLLILHGRGDSVVPFEKGFYLGMKHFTPVYGGKAVYDEALRTGIKAKAVFYDFGHAVPDRYKKGVFDEMNKFVRENLNCTAETLKGND